MLTNKELRQVNKSMRAKDESNLWPINGRFNVTERAIRKAREFSRHNGSFSSAYEYEACLEGMISEIVNSPNLK